MEVGLDATLRVKDERERDETSGRVIRKVFYESADPYVISASRSARKH